jgi:GYF domain 2
MPDFYIQAGEFQFGPLSASDVRELAAAGRITPKHHVRKGEEGEWHPASEVKGLVFGSIQPPATVPRQQQSRWRVAVDSTQATFADVTAWTTNTLLPWWRAQLHTMSPKDRATAAFALTVIIVVFFLTVANLVSPEWMSSRSARQTAIDTSFPIESHRDAVAGITDADTAANPSTDDTPEIDASLVEAPVVDDPVADTIEPSPSEAASSPNQAADQETVEWTDGSRTVTVVFEEGMLVSKSQNGLPETESDTGSLRDLTMEKFRSLYVGAAKPFCQAVLGGLGTTIGQRTTEEPGAVGEISDSTPPRRPAKKKTRQSSPPRSSGWTWGAEDDDDSEKPPKKITIGKFNECRMGSSRRWCESVLGTNFKTMSEMEYGQGTEFRTKTETVEWHDGWVSVVITFENGKVISKIQFGL